jgi:hypothetical protein
MSLLRIQFCARRSRLVALALFLAASASAATLRQSSALFQLMRAPLLGSPAQAGAIQAMPAGARSFYIDIPPGASTAFTFCSWIRVANLCTNRVCQCVTSSLYSFGSATNALPRGRLRAIDGLDWQLLALTNAAWGRANALTGSSGYWTLNIQTDAALTLAAAGNTLAIAASDSRQEFLIAALDASRDISISAARAGATVRFAAAEQPILQCYGRMNGVSDAEKMTIDPSTVITNEFVFCIQRVSIAGGAHAYRSDMLHSFDPAPSGLTSTWTMPENGLVAFAPDAFYQFGLIAFQLDPSSQVEAWNPRTYPAWLSNDDLISIRDADLREMTLRGIPLVK